MNQFLNKRALITGASSGIGRAVAFDLAHRGVELFLLARREERLKIIQKELSERYPRLGIHLIGLDARDPSLPRILEEVTKKHIDILINNAGLALGKDRVEESQLEDWEEMISTNIISHFKLVHQILPWMLKRGEGDIINVSSVAGHYTYAGGAVYCATKHAVKAFTRVLREETCGKNIRVMQISPGMVETEFSQVRFKGDPKASGAVYAGMNPLTPEDISRMMLFMLESPRHVVIDEIITMPTDQGGPTTVNRRITHE